MKNRTQAVGSSHADQARRSLDAVGWQVDYIITHCAPTSIALMGSRHNEADRLTDFLQEVRERAKYHYWLFGHYHDNKAIDEKHILLWEQIVRVIRDKAAKERTEVLLFFPLRFLDIGDLLIK
nr:hypothetical protein [Lacrimispora amygdalina]